MTLLADLLRTRLPAPIDEQSRINREFEAAVREGPLGWRNPNGLVPPTGLLIVVGLMVPWNEYDRILVVLLEQAAGSARRDGERIEVFNADAVSSPEAMESMIPGAGRSPQSPFLGVWKDGTLWFHDWGNSAATWLLDRYGQVE